MLLIRTGWLRFSVRLKARGDGTYLGTVVLQWRKHRLGEKKLKRRKGVDGSWFRKEMGVIRDFCQLVQCVYNMNVVLTDHHVNRFLINPHKLRGTITIKS